jgi:hypothetical protein
VRANPGSRVPGQGGPRDDKKINYSKIQSRELGTKLLLSCPIWRSGGGRKILGLLLQLSSKK